MKIDPYYQRQKCSPMTLVSGNIRLCGYSRGSPGRGCQMTVGLSMSAIFWRFIIMKSYMKYTIKTHKVDNKNIDLGGYFFVNVRDKTCNITWRYATPCQPAIDCKMNDLE